MKKTVKINESQLRNIIKESIKRCLNERSIDRLGGINVDWDGAGLDNDEEDSYVEMEGWVKKMCELFGARVPKLQSYQDIQNGTIRTQNGLMIEYSIVGYGNDGDGIECDVRLDGSQDRDAVEDYIRNAVSIEPSFFKLDMDYDVNPNFVRFRLIPFNLG